jgi:membrane protease YdiL (CAAX protease family)
MICAIYKHCLRCNFLCFPYTMLYEGISRLAILFLIFAVISSAFVVNVGMSCQMQEFLGSNMMGMHAVGWLMTFVFLAMEGGMSFNPSVDREAPTDWTRINVISTTVISALIYAIFVTSSKMQLVPNLVFFGTLMIMYMLISHRRFLKDRNRISKEQDTSMQRVIEILLVVLIVVGVYGVVDYVGYQKEKHGAGFSWSRFFVGTRTCDRTRHMAL